MNFVAKFTGRALSKHELANLRNSHTRQRNKEIDRRIRVNAKTRKLNQEFRSELVSRVVEILRDGTPTVFAREGACHHGVRSYLCIEGWGWDDADRNAADIVSNALNRLGAQRPTWLQGQPEYRGKSFHGNYRRCGNPKCQSLLEEYQAIFCSEHCSHYVAQRRWIEQNREEAAIMGKIARDKRRRADPEKYTIMRREGRLRAQERWDIKECKACGKQFNARPGRDNPYCSLKCYWSVGQVNETRSCVVCSTKFFVSKKTDPKIYCSKACWYSREESQKVRSCAICFAQFRVRSKGTPTQTCSMPCRMALRKRGPNKPNNFKCEPVSMEKNP